MFGSGTMANVGLGFTMTLKDEVSAVATKINNSLSMTNKTISQIGQGFTIAGGAIAGAGAGMTMQLVKGVQQASAFEGTLKTIQGITGDAFSDKDLEQMEYRIDKITSTLPMSSQQMADAMRMAAQQGFVFGMAGEEAIKTLEALGFEAAQLSAVVGDISAEEALGGMGAALKQFNMDIKENAGAMADAMLQTRNATRATIPWLMEINSRAAGTAHVFGLTAAEFQGVAGAVADVVTQPMGAASGLSMVFNSILQRSDKFAKLMGMSLENFQGAMEQKGGPAVMLQAIVHQLGTLKKFEQANIFKELGIGGRFATRVMHALIAADKTMIGDQTRLATVIGMVNRAWLQGLQRGNEVNAFYKRMSQTAGALFKTYQGNIENINKALGKALLEAIKPFLSAMIQIQSAFLDISPAGKKIIATALAIGAAFLTLGGAVIGALGLIMFLGPIIAPALLPLLGVMLALGAAGLMVAGTMKAMSSGTKTVFVVMQEMGVSAMEALSDSLEGLGMAWDVVGPGLEQSFRDLGNAIIALFDVFGIELGQGTDWRKFGAIVGMTLGIIITKINNALTNIVYLFGTYFQAIAWVWEKIGFVVGRIMNGEGFKDLGLGIVTFFSNVSVAIVKALNTIGNKLFDLGESFLSTPFIGQAITVATGVDVGSIAKMRSDLNKSNEALIKSLEDLPKKQWEASNPDVLANAMTTSAYYKDVLTRTAEVNADLQTKIVANFFVDSTKIPIERSDAKSDLEGASGSSSVETVGK